MAPGLLRTLAMEVRSSWVPPNAAHLIRHWRRRVGETQEGLARALDVTFSTVSRWENGHARPSKLAWRAMQQLAAERGCPLMADDVDERASVRST
jgi:putative transcriptional regulator